jgi:hypothetical protein
MKWIIGILIGVIIVVAILRKKTSQSKREIHPKHATLIRDAEAFGMAIYKQDTLANQAINLLCKLNISPYDWRIIGWLTLLDKDGKDVVRFYGTDEDQVIALYQVSFPTGRTPICEDLEATTASPEESAIFRARQLAFSSMKMVCSSMYNTAVFPNPQAEGWLVYLLAATSDPYGFFVGGHHRVTVNLDGSLIIKSEPLSKSCLQLQCYPGMGDHAVTTFEATPNETHIFASLSIGKPLTVVTVNGFVWHIRNGKVSAESKSDFVEPIETPYEPIKSPVVSDMPKRTPLSVAPSKKAAQFKLLPLNIWGRYTLENAPEEFGKSFLIFTYEDPQAGLSAKGGPVREPITIEQIEKWIDAPEITFRLESQNDVTPLSDEEVKALALPPTPDWLKFYGPQGGKGRPWRQDQALAGLFHPRFIDDIPVCFPFPESDASEMIWVRLDGVADKEKGYMGKLLAKPFTKSSLEAGDYVKVQTLPGIPVPMYVTEFIDDIPAPPELKEAVKDVDVNEYWRKRLFRLCTRAIPARP